MIAAHESPKTTKLYDRTGDRPTLDDIERIRFRRGSNPCQVWESRFLCLPDAPPGR